MGFKKAIKNVFTNYANFGGRASRSEYWYFSLFDAIVLIALSFVGPASKTTGVTLAVLIYSCAVFLPKLAVTFRRLHDIGKSDPWIFLELIPVVGPIVLNIMFLMDSEPGDNEYGPNPKGY